MANSKFLKGNMPLLSVKNSQTEFIHKQCEFCLISETRGTKAFRRLYGVNQILNVIGMPDSYCAIQDVVPIAENGAHILLIPKKKLNNGHYISLALETNQDDLVKARDLVMSRIRKAFPHYPIFTTEHGAGFIKDKQIACGGSHMDHAHGHIITLPKGSHLKPIKERTEQLLNQNGWEDTQKRAIFKKGIFTDIFAITGINPYLHIGMIYPDGSEKSYVYVQRQLSEHVESQFLRKVVAEVVYDQQETTYWHWRYITSGFSNPERITQLKTDIAKFRALTNL